MDAFSQLIDQTGQLLGIEALEPDADGVVEIISEDAAISVMRTGEVGEIVLLTATIPSTDAAPDAMQRALEFNAGADVDATISLDPDDGTFLLSTYYPLHALSPEGLMAKLESFATALSSVRELLFGCPRDDSAAPEENVPSDMNGFMMV